MLDNLRDQGSEPFFQEEEEVEQPIKKTRLKVEFKVSRKLYGTILGLKHYQVFVLLFMVLLVIFLLGGMFLLISGKIVL